MIGPAVAIELIAIDAIHVGLRRRQKLGRLQGLARSIQAHGLLHPLLVRNGNELVAGQRRLEACRSLGWTRIPVRRVDHLIDEELRAIELDENTEREALLDFEASKVRLAEIRQAEADLKREAETRPHGEHVSRGKRGPTRTPGSERDVAERTGVPPTTRRKIEDHVAIAERYPFMQKPDWRQYNVLEAGQKMETIPERERGSVAALLDQPAIPPKDAIKILDNLSAMPTEKRREIYTLAKADDPHARSRALTMAAKLPPRPDPGLMLLLDAKGLIERAARECRVPDMKARILALAAGVGKVIDRIRRATRGQD